MRKHTRCGDRTDKVTGEEALACLHAYIWEDEKGKYLYCPHTTSHSALVDVNGKKCCNECGKVVR